MLELENVQTYYGDIHVLHGVTLDVEEGEIVTLLGRNGAGKTTTLRSIIGMTPPREGEIRYKGEPIDGFQPYQISRRGIGFVPEDRRTFTELSVRDNLLAVQKKDSEWTLERVYEHFPALDEHSARLGGQLSGGQQQMLTIARALMTDPDLLLLDEPSEGLAPTIVADLKDLLESIIDTGITVFFTEQNIEFAFDIAERGYILSSGQVEWGGTIDELQDRENLIGTYLSLEHIGVDD